MEKNHNFKPYVSSEKNIPELTLTSIITGVILAIVFGAANAYLGLRVGMTVSASIPAAVIAMGVIRMLLRRNSILESNIVQTVGSAGESLAAGAIFTLPALFLWAAEGKTDPPSVFEITLISLIGGLLGVFFMVPLRNALIVKEHGILPYPEGTACSEVLLAGEKGGASASIVFFGMGLSAVFKFIIDGLKIVSGEITLHFKSFAGAIGTQIYPAVMSVGFICGPKIASYMFAGGVLSWLVLIPAIVLFGSEIILFPGDKAIGSIFSEGGASMIWSLYIRYIGAGALACGGIISLIKSLPLIIKTFLGAVKGISEANQTSTSRTEKSLNMKIVLISILLLAFLVWIVPAVPVNIIGAAVIVFFGFFFTAVSSRMVGLVGSSNNPVSGMAIATLIIATLILKFTGNGGISGMCSAISIGSVICIISSIAGDTSQDLKTGFLLGATPKKQQIGEIIGVVFASLAIGGTLYLLDKAWGFGTEQLAAPQATLMKMIIEGVMEGNLPWGLVLIGVFIAVVIELLGVPVLPFAIGVYLPVQLNACIMTGGLIRLIIEKTKRDENEKMRAVNNGTLFCSGMIAGEGIMGLLLAVFSILGLDSIIDISSRVGISSLVSDIGGIIIFAFSITSVFLLSRKKER